MLVLWAWDRPEDLRFLDPTIDSVAAFEALVRIDTDHGVRVRPRLHPLRVPEGMLVEGVVRVDVPTAMPLDQEVRLETVRAILAYHRADHTAGLQIDFDARRTERVFYAALLRDLRQRLAPEQTLTITALASWCVGDRWLDRLPIDDAVPMLFRMGVDDQNLRSYFAAGGDLRSTICQRSLGLSTDEPWPTLPSGRRQYIFHPTSWTREDVAALGQRRRVVAASGTSGAEGKQARPAREREKRRKTPRPDQ